MIQSGQVVAEFLALLDLRENCWVDMREGEDWDLTDFEGELEGF